MKIRFIGYLRTEFRYVDNTFVGLQDPISVALNVSQFIPLLDSHDFGLTGGLLQLRSAINDWINGDANEKEAIKLQSYIKEIYKCIIIEKQKHSKNISSLYSAKSLVRSQVLGTCYAHAIATILRKAE